MAMLKQTQSVDDATVANLKERSFIENAGGQLQGRTHDVGGSPWHPAPWSSPVGTACPPHTSRTPQIQHTQLTAPHETWKYIV